MFNLWPERFLFHYMQITGEALVQQLFKESNGIHITSANV